MQMNEKDCITCYAKLTVHIDGEEIETCHKCLVCKYELIAIDWINELLEDYTFNSGFCEQCLSNCSTVVVRLCHEHELTFL